MKISQMSDKEKRKIRKQWQNRARKSRANKKQAEKILAIISTLNDMDLNHSSVSPISEQMQQLPKGNGSSTSRKMNGANKRRQNREMIRKEINILKKDEKL